jgi:hypothetical protein
MIPAGHRVRLASGEEGVASHAPDGSLIVIVGHPSTTSLSGAIDLGPAPILKESELLPLHRVLENVAHGGFVGYSSEEMTSLAHLFNRVANIAQLPPPYYRLPGAAGEGGWTNLGHVADLEDD